MTLVELLSALRAVDITIWAEDGQLGYSAPPGALTPELRAELVARKGELIALLTRVSPRADAPVAMAAAQSHPRVAPLSFAQQRLWLLDQLEPGSATYNIPAAMRFAGTLDVSVLARSLNEVLRRHEALRTTFRTEDEQPVQIVAPFAPRQLVVIDLRALAAAEREIHARQLVDAEALQSFDLVDGPLLRMSLLRLDAHEHLLLLTLHHIVADGWSMGVLVREVAALYRAFSAGRPAALPELPIQYADYALWQREQLQGVVLESHLAYWRQQLDGLPPVLDLPLDRPRPPVRTFRSEQRIVRLAPDLSSGLRALSRSEQATLFMTLLAALDILLARYSGQADIVVGTPVAGRNRPELDGMIGCFLNTLVLRVNLSGNPGFRELLGRVRAVCLQAYTHQDVPFEKLLEELQPKRDLSYTPLFQVFLNMINLPEIDLDLSGLAGTLLATPDIGAKFDITLYVREWDAEIELHLVYNADLFTPARMAELLEQFQQLLAQIVARPEAPIGQLSLLTSTARARLPDPRAPLDASWQGAIHTRLAAWAQRAPERVALVDACETWTYADLDAWSSQLARHFVAQGIRPQDAVAIYAHRSAALVGAILGVLKAGAAFTILDPAYPAARLIEYLGLARPRGWLQIAAAGAPPEELEACLATLAPCCRLTLPGRAASALLAGYPAEAPAIEVGPDDLACITFTSGSTGAPKGILGRHGPLTHFLPWQSQTFGLGEIDCFSMLSGLAHDPLQRDIFTPLWLGATLCVPSPEVIGASGQLAEWMRQHAISVVHLTPALGQLLVKTTDGATAALPALRYAFIVGDVLTRRDVARIRALAPAITCVNLYGSTETQRAVGYYVVLHDAEPAPGEAVPSERAEILPLGRGMQDVQLLVLNSAGQLAGVGELGEIYMRSPHLACGYLGDEALTYERFIPNPFSDCRLQIADCRLGDEDPAIYNLQSTIYNSDRLYKTGDLGRYLPDGTVVFCGRSDQQVKLRGFRVELGEIEAVLSRHHDVRDVVVVARAVGPDDLRLVAYVVLNRRSRGGGQEADEVVLAPLLPDPRSSIAALRSFLKERLPDYMVPGSFVLLEALPLTPNGKVDRRALPAPQMTAQPLANAPRTPIEELLGGIWAAVLHLDSIGLDDNFFELGGHSLLATQVIARLRDTLHVELPLRALFEAPTLADLAVRVEAARATIAEAAIEPLSLAARGGPLPLAFAQQRLWFLVQLEPGSPAYTIPCGVALTGSLDVPALKRSLDQLIQRHEALRTIFAAPDGQPVQVIAPNAVAALPVLDLSLLPASARWGVIQQIASEAAVWPFDLARGPLLRAVLLRLASHEHALILMIHHIVADGWSLNVLLRDLSALYGATIRGRPAALPPLPVQYADYAVWQRTWLEGGVLEAQIAYWRAQLADQPGFELPTDRPRPRVPTFRGAEYRLRISSALLGALHQFSRQEGVTLFMTLLAAFQVLLSRYSGQEDVSIGTPVANRTRAEVENLIGCFANTLVMRASLSGSPTFRELLARVREMALDVYAHQDLPFEHLVDSLQLERDLSRNPLFQVMFILQNAPIADWVLPGLTLSAMQITTGTAKFDLTLSMLESDGDLFTKWEYAIDLFDAATIERMAAHFRALLESALARLDLPIGQMPLLSAAERQQLLVAWNATARAYPAGACLHDLVADQAARTPDAIALVFDDIWLSYRGLDEWATQVARDLGALQVGPDVRVGICMERSPELVAGLLGVLKAGGAYVPLDPSYPPARLAWILEDAQVPVLLTNARLPVELPASSVQILSLGAAMRGRERPVPLARSGPVTPDHLAYVIYTSGSTGRPKGVQIPHRAVVNFLSSMREQPGLTADDVLLAVTTVSFDIAALELFLPLSVGARLVIASREIVVDGARLGALLADCGATVLQATPATWRLLLEAGWAGAPQLTLLCGGEALPRDLAQQLLARGAALWNMYGPTETTIWSTIARVADAGGAVTIGRPIANTEVYLLDLAGQPVPIGVPGELLIGGAGLARGYLGRPDLTAERFVPNPFADQRPTTNDQRPTDSTDYLRSSFVVRRSSRLYKTGDVARYRADGTIEYLGRGDHQVKVRGFRIELGEIESVLSQHGAVRQSVVVAREDTPGDTRLVAYVVPTNDERRTTNDERPTTDHRPPTTDDDRPPSAQRLAPSAQQRTTDNGQLTSELRSFLQERLPAYMVPSAFVALPALPLTPNGKVDRAALPAPAADTAALDRGPRTPVEELLNGIWAAVLHQEHVGAADDFFMLGGHSLLATRLMARLRDTFGVDLPLRSLFEAPTLSGMAAQIMAAREAGPTLLAPPIHPHAHDGRAPLSFAQQRLWFLDQMQPGNSTYNVFAAARLSGALDMVALTRSLSAIVRRHEVLRTTFAIQEGQPVQVIGRCCALALTVLDLTALPAPTVEQTLQTCASAEVRRPFDLARGPLVRALLLRLGERVHALVLTLHHIVVDGWSIGVLFQELAALYPAFAAGRRSPLPALPVQYADYAAWQREWLQGAVLESHLAYWRQQLAGTPPALELSTDRPRPPIQTTNGEQHRLALPAELRASLVALSRQEGVTPFMLLLAAFQVLLARYSGQDDIVVGAPISGRTRSEIEGLIGVFINTLVLRADLSGDPTFRTLLRRVRTICLDAYAHQDLPFEQLVEALQPERDLSRSPLFQVLFIFENRPLQPLALAGLDVAPLDLSGGSAKFDLTLYLIDDGSALVGSIEYNTDLFEATTIARMAEHFQTLLGGIAARPEARLTALPLLSAAEQEQMLVAWNATGTVYLGDACLHDLVAAQAARSPDAIAVVYADGCLSYRELNQRAEQLARHLRELELGSEARVGIFLERSLELLVALLGTLKAGAAYVPLDPTYPLARLSFMLEDAAPPIVLTHAHLRDRLPEYPARVLALDADWPAIARTGAGRPLPVVLPDRLAYVIYTSGSTGRPKGVQIAHRALINVLCDLLLRIGLTERDGLLAVTTLAFDIAALELYMPLLVGARVLLAHREAVADGAHLSALISATSATVMQATPLTWQLLVQAGWAGSPRLTVLCGGEALPRDLADQLLERSACVWNLYGPTETTIWSMVRRVGTGTGPVAIGRPIANTQIYLLDRHLNPAPIGVPGELCIGGVGLARGYLNRPDLTAERFVPNPFADFRFQISDFRLGDEDSAIYNLQSTIYNSDRLYRTGDLACYRQDGVVEYLGRRDQQIKLRGFRIELGEVEALLRQHPGVREGVVSVQTVAAERRLVAYVVPKLEDRGLKIEDSLADAPEMLSSIFYSLSSELRAFLLAHMPHYMVPTAFVLLHALPLTPNGKLDRRALPPPSAPRREASAIRRTPRTDLERKIAAIWQAVLQLDEVEVDDNFFDLGGNSFHLAQIQRQLRDALGLEVAVVDLFQYPTIAAIVKHLGQEQPEQDSFDPIRDRIQKQRAILDRQKQTRSRR